MKTMTFETAKKINQIVAKKGLTCDEVISKLKKIDGFVSLDFYKSLKFNFDNESIEMLMAVRHFYKWLFSKEYKNPMFFHSANFNYTLEEINKKYELKQ